MDPVFGVVSQYDPVTPSAPICRRKGAGVRGGKDGGEERIILCALAFMPVRRHEVTDPNDGCSWGGEVATLPTARGRRKRPVAHARRHMGAKRVRRGLRYRSQEWPSRLPEGERKTAFLPMPDFSTCGNNGGLLPTVGSGCSGATTSSTFCPVAGLDGIFGDWISGCFFSEYLVNATPNRPWLFIISESLR